MFEAIAQVQNEQGIHCRPSALIIKHAAHYQGSIRVRGDRGQSDLRSITGLMMLALERGARVTIEVDGANERTMGSELVELFETHFDFPAENS